MKNSQLESRPCKICGKQIVFISMDSGRLMPCDADSETTTISIATGKVQKGLIPHWATCAGADQMRKGAKNGSY